MNCFIGRCSRLLHTMLHGPGKTSSDLLMEAHKANPTHYVAPSEAELLQLCSLQGWKWPEAAHKAGAPWKPAQIPPPQALCEPQGCNTQTEPWGSSTWLPPPWPRAGALQDLPDWMGEHLSNPAWTACGSETPHLQLNPFATSRHSFTLQGSPLAAPGSLGQDCL